MKNPRGAALIIGFALIVLLAALAISFASRMTSNQLRVESDVAVEAVCQERGNCECT